MNNLIIKEEDVGRVFSEKSVITSKGIRLVESGAVRCEMSVDHPEVCCGYDFDGRTIDVFKGTDYVGVWFTWPFFEENALTYQTCLSSFQWHKGADLSKEERFDVLKTLAEHKVYFSCISVLEDFAMGQFDWENDFLDEFLQKYAAKAIKLDSGRFLLCKKQESCEPKVVAYGQNEQQIYVR